MNIALNFYTNSAGGTIGFKFNIIKQLQNLERSNAHNYFVIADKKTAELFKETEIKFIILEPSNKLDIFYFYISKANQKLKEHKIDRVINFGDIPIRTNIDQTFYFDWPYAVYRDQDIWKRMSFKDYFSKKLKLFFFEISIKYVNKWIAQTELMKRKLENNYALKNISVVDMGLEPNQDNLNKNIDKKNYLVYPTIYYPHKNIEILLGVAELIKKNNDDLSIILTITKEDHKKSKTFIEKVYKNKLEKILVIKGRLERNILIDFLLSSRGLLMPALIESYGLPYIEAQSLGIPIFTSNRDFAKELCKDSAFYFDPHNSKDIYNCITNALANEKIINEKLEMQNEILIKKITWSEVTEKIINVCKK